MNFVRLPDVWAKDSSFFGVRLSGDSRPFFLGIVPENP